MPASETAVVPANIQLPDGSCAAWRLIASDDRDPHYACYVDTDGTLMTVRKMDGTVTMEGQEPYVCRTCHIPLGDWSPGSAKVVIANYGLSLLAYVDRDAGAQVRILRFDGARWQVEFCQRMGRVVGLEWQSGPLGAWLCVMRHQDVPLAVFPQSRSWFGGLIFGPRRWKSREAL